MTSDVKVFDMPHAVNLAEAKKDFLNGFLPRLARKYDLKTAIDVGCGFGSFAEYLTGLGLEVTAVDGRDENIAETGKRNPGIKCQVRNVEDPGITNIGSYDITFCVGLLYHLENPFIAIRNLAEVTEKILVIETMAAPYREPAIMFYEEGEDKDQGLNYCALIPSESCFTKMLYKAGFTGVYKFSSLPDHMDFRGSTLSKPKRTMLIASKIGLEDPVLNLIKYPDCTNRYAWYKFGLRTILQKEGLRKVLKKIMRNTIN